MRSLPMMLVLPGVLFACPQEEAPTADLPAGLWDAHTHLTYWGEDALDSLTKYGIVGVRDLGGNPVLLRQWRNEIAAGTRRGPRILFAGPLINGPRPDSTNRLIVRTPADARRAIDSLVALRVDFVKTHGDLKPDAYFAVLREGRRAGLRVVSHLPESVTVWAAADSGVSDIEHIVESVLVSPAWAGFATTMREAREWWASAAGDTMIAHIARTGVTLTPTLAAYVGFIEMSTTQAQRDGRQAVYDFTFELTGRFHRAGVRILAGSDFADRDYDQPPGRGLLREIDALVRAGLTREEAERAAGSNITDWLTGRPPPR